MANLSPPPCRYNRRRANSDTVLIAAVLVTGVSGLQPVTPQPNQRFPRRARIDPLPVARQLTVENVFTMPMTPPPTADPAPTNPTGGDFTRWKFHDPHTPLHVRASEISGHMTNKEHQNGVQRCLSLMSSLGIPAAQQLAARGLAQRIAEASSDFEATVASLLFQALRDGDITLDRIVDEFGAEIALLAANLAKLVQLEADSHEQLWSDQLTKQQRLDVDQAANLREMLLSTSNDWRALMIMMVHRVQEMTTDSAVSARARSRETRMIAREALDVYAPLAHRLGMSQLKDHFEDAGFRMLYPLQHRLLTSCLDRRADAYEALLAEQRRALKRLLQEDDVLINAVAHVEVQGRTKSPYSTWRKLLKSLNSDGRPIDVVREDTTDSVLDAVALRVVIEPMAGASTEMDSEQLCSHVQDLIHREWPAMAGRTKNYIAEPKPNGYQALHTTVRVRRHGRELPFEVQIKTRDMHDQAEWGAAAHHHHTESVWEWLLGKDGKQEHQAATAGLAQAAMWEGAVDNADSDFAARSQLALEAAGEQSKGKCTSALEYANWWHSELQRNHVFVLGHDHQVWKLDRGATVGGIDQDLLVNGIRMPLNYKLRNGDVLQHM